MLKEKITEVAAADVGSVRYDRLCTGAIIVDADGKLVLQQRDAEATRGQHNLSTFGGGVDDGETPLACLQRELSEEIGLVIDPAAAVPLGIIAVEWADMTLLIHSYFYRIGTEVMGPCTEGYRAYYDSAEGALAHPRITEDLRWALEKCAQLGLLRKAS